MNRTIVLCALFVVAAATLGAQDSSQASPYQGTSNPPADDTIETSSTPAAKPSAGRPVTPPQDQSQSQPQPSSVDPSANYVDPELARDIVDGAQQRAGGAGGAMDKAGLRDGPGSFERALEPFPAALDAYRECLFRR